MEHTQGTWRVSDKSKRVVCYGHDEVVINSEANARRIVSCINAMAGIDDDNVLFRRGSIGTVRKHIVTQQVQIEKLTAKRDELLAVLEAMLEEVAGCYCATEASARAVIQKVRGGEC